jgi:general secretion pathway protein D
MKKIALVLITALAAAACVTFNSNYKLGAEAEINKKFDEAIAAYEKAALENPKESVYRLAIERAKLSAGLFHLQEARRLIAAGKRAEAQAEYAKVMAYNPRDTQVALEARLQAVGASDPAESVPEKIEFPIKLKVKNEPGLVRVPLESSLRSIFLTLGKAAGINVVFDENFRDVPFTADLSGQSFEQTLKTICQATKNFYRILDERTVIVVPDQPLKRIQYEVSCIRTFALSNIVAQDVFGALSQMLRTQFAAPNIIFDKTLNTITVRGTAQVVELADKLIRNWDKAKGEVIIDLEIMEVSRLKLRQLGLNLESNILGLRFGQTTSTTDTSSGWYSLKGLGLGKAENYFASLPSAYVQFLESDADTKIIAQPRLRGISDEKITDKVGQKIPIPRTMFTPFAAGGYAQQPITNFEFQDVGIEINITPRVHLEREVTLDAEIKVTSIGGKGYADIPIINNRELKCVMRLRDGESQLIAGLLRDEERKTIKGIPGLKDIPGLGRLFGSEDTTIEQTDVIMTITPYIIRAVKSGPEDTKPIWVDVDAPASGAAGGVFEEDMLDRDLNPEAAQRALQQRRGSDLAANMVALSPADANAVIGRDIRLAVNVRSDQDVSALSLTINYNPRVVFLKDVSEGGLTRQLGAQTPFLKNIDNAAGVCTIGFSSPQMGKGAKGGGTLATLLFEAKSAGEAVIGISGTSGLSASGGAIAFTADGARIVVR